MMAFIPPRLRKPLWNALAGTLFAAAWLVRGGPTWWISIMTVVVVAVRVIVMAPDRVQMNVMVCPATHDDSPSARDSLVVTVTGDPTNPPDGTTGFDSAVATGTASTV